MASVALAGLDWEAVYDCGDPAKVIVAQAVTNEVLSQQREIAAIRARNLSIEISNRVGAQFAASITGLGNAIMQALSR